MNTKPDPLSIPTDLTAAVMQLMALLDDANQLESFKGKTPNECAGLYHHSLGTYIRNEWGLWASETPISKHLESLGVFHGDDKSAAIFRALWHHVNGTIFDLPAYLELCRAHWAEYGLDSRGMPPQKGGRR